jgi:hypothetical protein
VPGVRHNNAARPVDPSISPGIEDLKAFGTIPYNWRLSLHSQRLDPMQRLDHRQRPRRG